MTPRLVPCLLLLLLVVACGGGEEPAAPTAQGPQRGGTAVLGSPVDVDATNQYEPRQDFTGKVLRRLYLRLAEPRAQGPGNDEGYEPSLAESWEAGDDGLTLSFRLREANWSDGTPIDADDVVFTWRAQTDEAVAWIGAASKRSIEAVEAIDPRTVRFRFTHAYPHQMSDAIEGGIVPEHVFGAVPFDAWRTHDWSTTPIASGPFVLERHTPAQEIRLARNDAYHDPERPYLDGITIRVVPDASNLVTQLLGRQLDYIEGVAPREARRIEGTRAINVVAFEYPKYDYVGWNGNRPPFDDPAMRRALTMAIDRRALVEDLLYGYGQVSHGPLMSWWWGVDESLETVPYDPAATRRILRERGYAVRGVDGTRGDGETLELTIMTNAGNRLRESMLVKIQHQLGLVGIDVEIETLEMRALIGKAMEGEYDAYLGGWTLLGSLDLRTTFGSSSAPPAGSNVVFYANPQLDDALDRIEAASDWDAVRAPLSEAQRVIRDDQPYTFLYETKRIAAFRERLADLDIRSPDSLAGFDRAWMRVP